VRRGDKVTVSFGLKPLLLQHMTSDYGPISIITAGNQIRGAKGMKAEVEIDNVHLDGNDQSQGTIGVLDAAVIWPSSSRPRSRSTWRRRSEAATNTGSLTQNCRSNG